MQTLTKDLYTESLNREDLAGTNLRIHPVMIATQWLSGKYKTELALKYNIPLSEINRLLAFATAPIDEGGLGIRTRNYRGRLDDEGRSLLVEMYKDSHTYRTVNDVLDAFNGGRDNKISKSTLYRSLNKLGVSRRKSTNQQEETGMASAEDSAWLDGLEYKLQLRRKLGEIERSIEPRMNRTRELMEFYRNVRDKKMVRKTYEDMGHDAEIAIGKLQAIDGESEELIRKIRLKVYALVRSQDILRMYESARESPFSRIFDPVKRLLGVRQ